MTPPTLKRIIGIVFLLAAAVAAVLELRKGDGPGALFIPSVLFIIGMAFVLRARGRRL